VVLKFYIMSRFSFLLSLSPFSLFSTPFLRKVPVDGTVCFLIKNLRGSCFVLFPSGLFGRPS